MLPAKVIAILKNKKNIAYLGGGKELFANEERFAAFKDILQNNSLFNPKLVANSHEIRKDGYLLVEELLEKNKLSTIMRFFTEKAYQKADLVIAQTPEMKNELSIYHNLNTNKIG